MAKNAVTDWSATDSLNTDIGSTNIAEGCAPGGINDAIRKVMAQIATFIANVTIGNTTINGTLGVNSPTATITDTQIPKIDLVRSGIATWRVGGSGTAGDNSFNVTLNALSPALSIDTGNQTVAMAGAARSVGGYSTSGMLRVTGQSAVGLNITAGIEMLYDGTFGIVQAYDRAGGAYKPLRLYGSDIAIGPQAGPASISLLGNTNNAGVLSVGGSALGGVSGQVQFNTSAGAANAANITMITGTELRTTNTTAGSVTTYINGTLQHTISATGLFARSLLRSGPVGAGAVQLAPGDATKSGYIEFLDTAGSSTGYIQQPIGGDINYFNQNGAAGHFFNGAYVGIRKPSIGGLSLNVGTASLTGKLVMTDAIGNPSATIGGQTIGQATAYANAAGHAFAGGAMTVAGNVIGAAGALITGAAAPTGVGARIEYAGGTAVFGGFDYGAGVLKPVNFNGSTLQLRTGSGGVPTTRVTIADAAVTVAPPLFAQSYVQASGMVDGVTPGDGTTGGLRSRGDSGGGAAILQFTDRDSSNEWVSIIADPSGNKVTIVVGHVGVFSVDSSGNVRCAGTLTQNAVI